MTKILRGRGDAGFSGREKSLFRRFFSLLELVIVFGIIALLAGIAMPLAMSPEDNSMETVCRRITNLFESARTHAQMSGSIVKLNIDLDARRFESAGGGGGARNVDISERNRLDPRYQNRTPNVNQEQLRTESAEGRALQLQIRAAMLADIPPVELPDNYRLEAVAGTSAHPYVEELNRGSEVKRTVTAEFRPDGTASMPRIRIENDDETRSIEILPLTGRIQIQEEKW